jgi:SSS family solute:Na+ symporter
VGDVSPVYFWTILVYLLILVGVGVRSTLGVSTQEDFSVAGRKLNTFVLFGTMLATWIGTGSIFGNAEKTYAVGIAAFILPLGSIFGIWVLSRLAGRARSMRQITIQDLLETRYNATARLCGVVALVLAYTTIVSYQYRAAGAVLNLTLPQLSYERAVVVVAVFIILYTALAGMLSLAYIGVIQGVTMIFGIALTLPVFFYEAGGLEGMRQTLGASHMEPFGPIGPLAAAGLVLPPFLLVLGDANMYQRFFSARSAGIARRAVIWMLAGVAFMELAIIASAWAASALEPNLEIPGRVIAFAARDHLPRALGALLLTTIMAIVLSTAGSYLLAPATAVVRDVYQRFLNPGASERSLVLLLRLTVVFLGIAAYAMSQLSDEFLSVALLAYTIYGASITPSLVAAFFWRRATARGAVASIVSGTATTLLWQWLGAAGIDAVLPAIAVSVLTLVVVSLAGRPPAPEQVAPFFTPEQGEGSELRSEI